MRACACAAAANRAVNGASFSSSSSSSSSSARPRPAATLTTASPLFRAPSSFSSKNPSLLSSMTFTRGAKWSVETEKGHVYRNPDEIIDDAAITRALETTREKAKDPAAVAAVLEAARERAFLRAPPPPAPSERQDSVVSSSDLPDPGPSEFVRGLSIEDAAILLNVDANDQEAMRPIFETAFRIKNCIYGNRVVLFAPLYIANWCVNSCRYCAFR